MRNRAIRTFPWVVACALAALFSLAPHAHGKVLFEQNYRDAARRAGKPVDGDSMEGFRARYTYAHGTSNKLMSGDPKAFAVAPGKEINPSAGTFAFHLTYAPPFHKKEGMDTLFALEDKAGRKIMGAYIVWDEASENVTDGGRGGVAISSDGLGMGLRDTILPADVWGFWLPFPRKIAEGETFDIRFAWDNAGTRVYLNDNVLTGYESAVEGGVVAPPGKPFGPYLADVATLHLGRLNRKNKEIHGDLPMTVASISSFEIHDRALGPAAPRPVIRAVSDDSFNLPGISGRLIAGDRVTATLVSQPGGTATFDMGRVRGIPMTELPPDPGGGGKETVVAGTYRGSYTIRPGDDFAEGRIAGNFVSADNVAAEPVLSKSVWTIETRPRVTFEIPAKDLPADEGTKSRIKLKAKDANGNPLPGRNFKLTLSTTDEYTGLVGAGDFGKQVGASVETRWNGKTDAWGELEFEYTAGFAAKTVILQAKDLDSSGVSVDYITAFKEASIDIALTAPRSLAASRRGQLYTIRVEASRTQLTADGRSRSVIRATVLDPAGSPVEGEPVAFSLSTPNGVLKTIRGTTDRTGVATAEYVAGKKIGIVVITATDTARNISGNVSILLTSDAPAKILLKARPESIPADGTSKANVQVRVTDINDNPNADTKVEFRLKQAAIGKLENAEGITDRYGDANNRFVAGTTPGIATIIATVRSKVPTEGELFKARNVIFVPYNEGDDSVRIEAWLRKKGDAVKMGEGIVTYTVGRDPEVKTLVAPYNLTLGETFVESWDRAEIGQTLATVVPAETR